MQRFRKSFFLQLLADGSRRSQVGPIARHQASWYLKEMSSPNGDMNKYHRRERDAALIAASRLRKWMLALLQTPADSQGNQPPFMPMRCKGGMVASTHERARLVACDVRRELARARYHREQIAPLER